MSNPAGYFDYFTAIEELYQELRGSFTLLSTSDWVLIESWRDSGIPLECVLGGIRQSFRPGVKVNSLAYCSRAVEAAFADHITSPPAPGS
jgi:hypothetical protein